MLEHRLDKPKSKAQMYEETVNVTISQLIMQDPQGERVTDNIIGNAQPKTQ